MVRSHCGKSEVEYYWHFCEGHAPDISIDSEVCGCHCVLLLCDLEIVVYYLHCLKCWQCFVRCSFYISFHDNIYSIGRPQCDADGLLYFGIDRGVSMLIALFDLHCPVCDWRLLFMLISFVISTTGRVSEAHWVRPMSNST